MDQSNGYFTISDLAKELDVKKNLIRFCEENGLIPPRASKLKRRVYNKYDRDRLKFIFHFVLLGYSKEQIIDLIGTPDGNLDENGQLIQGIEYGLKELKKLEKQKEELSFTRQARTINEIEMLREYIKKIDNIKSGVIEEPSVEPSIRFEKREKIPDKPFAAIAAVAEKKKTQHPVKVMSLFAAGLALVILIGSYFYYQAGQKGPVHSEKARVLQAPVPMDQIAKTPAEVQETQKLAQSSSDTPQDSLKVESTNPSPESTQPAEITPVVSEAVLAKEKDKPGNLEVEEKPKDAPPEKIAVEALPEKAAPALAGEDTLTAAVSEPVDEKAHDIRLEGGPEPKTAIKEPPEANDVALSPVKEKPGNLKVEEVPKDVVQEEAEPRGLKEKAVLEAADKETLMASKPELGEEKVAEIKTKAPLTEPEKEIKEITPKEGLTQQQNELNRLKAFLEKYCQAYSNKDLDKFITFFTSDATENNRPFHEMLPTLRKNMETIESLTYRIELISFSKQTTSENVMVRGRFFTRYQMQKGGWEENNGNIFMELIKNGDSFLVRRLTY